MSTRTLGIDDRLHDYLLRFTLRESEVLRELREETARMPMSRMQISPEQGQFMALLAELIGTRRAIEVGTFTGYSTLAVASVLPEGGTLIACDVNAEWTDIGRRYWAKAGLQDRIDLRLAPALQTLDALIQDGRGGTFDFAFIDADKQNYDGYYERCLALVRQGGLVLVDNALWNGDVADPDKQDDETSAIRALNDKVNRDPRVTSSLVPIGDGVLLTRKR